MHVAYSAEGARRILRALGFSRYALTSPHKSGSARHELKHRIPSLGTTGRGEVSAYFSRMAPVTGLAGAACAVEVRAWQEDLKRVVSGAKRRGFRIAAGDEPISVSAWRDGSKLWTPAGAGWRRRGPAAGSASWRAAPWQTTAPG